MKPEESEAAFKSFLRDKEGDFKTIPFEGAVDRFLRFYNEVHASQVLDQGNGGDMMLFQFGCYNFGKGEHFHFDLTRQFISTAQQDDDAISELNFTFLFEPTKQFRTIGEHNTWCRQRSLLPEFRSSIASSIAYSLALRHKPKSIDLRWSPVCVSAPVYYAPLFGKPLRPTNADLKPCSTSPS